MNKSTLSIVAINLLLLIFKLVFVVPAIILAVFLVVLSCLIAPIVPRHCSFNVCDKTEYYLQELFYFFVEYKF